MEEVIPEGERARQIRANKVHLRKEKRRMLTGKELEQRRQACKDATLQKDSSIAPPSANEGHIWNAAAREEAQRLLKSCEEDLARHKAEIARAANREVQQGTHIQIPFSELCAPQVKGFDIDRLRASEIREAEKELKTIRTFPSGAIRDRDEEKLDPEAFLSPLVIECYCQYMHQCRVQADGTRRSGDNWQKGIPKNAYLKSGWRHFLHVWLLHRKHGNPALLKGALCALLFNVMGYLHEVLMERDVGG